MNQAFINLRKIPVLFVLMLFGITASSQEILVSGTVTDALDGSPLIGVTVLVKGTTNGAITDINGKYSIKVTKDAILSYSFIGYETQEISPSGRAIIDIVLKEETKQIDELIVIGYGTQKKSDKTGAVAQISADELNKGVLQDPIQSLVGKSAGVLITKKGGDPNGGFSVKIRSQASLFASTEPLYVIDGVPGADITAISPDDIESFNVLKDASSSAIYGANGANGVIIITTKKGKSGKIGENIEFSSTLSIDNVAKKLNLLSASQLRSYVEDYGYSSTFIDGGANTDWQDQIYRTGITQTYSTSLSGGNDFNNFRTSLNQTKYEGVIKGSSKERTIGRINFSQKMFDNKLTFSATATGTVEKNNYVKYDGNGPQDVIWQALQRNPTDPVYTTDEKYYEIKRDFQYDNPLALISEIQNQRNAKRILGSISTDWEVIKGLKHWLSLSYTRDDEEWFKFEPQNGWANPVGNGKREFKNTEKKYLESTLTYNKDLFTNHNLNVVAGYSYQFDLYTGISAYGEGPTSNIIKSYNLASLNLVKQGDITSYDNTVNRISYFGRIIYNIDSKYIFTATLRRDGSSKFGANNRWGSFPSASVAWNIKKESFMNDFDFLDQLRLRVGYGVAGNDNFSSHAYMPVIAPDGTTFDYESGTYVPKYTSKYNANPDLKWEENRELNFGVDFGFFKNKVSGSFEYYRRKTVDQLVDVPKWKPEQVYPQVWINGGDFSSSGFEANIQYFAVTSKNLEWKTSLSFSTFKQKIDRLDSKWSANNNKKGWLQGRGLVGDQNWTQYIQEGWALGTFYMPEYAGISSDGKYLFYTAAGGVTRNIDMAERRVVGHALPKFEIGWSNSFTFYKNFDLNFSFRAVYGGDVLNVTRLIMSNPTLLPTINALDEALGNAKKGLTSAPIVNSLFLEDGSFIRLENLSLGYTFSKFKNNNYKLRFNITGNNLLLITKYKGTDPEMTYTGLEFGIDNFNVYPKTRSIMFGITLTL